MAPEEQIFEKLEELIRRHKEEISGLNHLMESFEQMKNGEGMKEVENEKEENQPGKDKNFNP
jgi:hypothetical protein